MNVSQRATRALAQPRWSLRECVRALRSAAAKPTEDESKKPKELSRWQLLKKQRKEAPEPKRRIPKGLDAPPLRPATPVGLAEAVEFVQKASWARFEESVDVAVRLNVDPRLSTQMVRTHALLPHGTGTRAKVIVLDGSDSELMEEIKSKKGRNLKDCKLALAPAHAAADVAKLAGRALGPRGLLPHEKDGTIVRDDMSRAVERAATQWVRLRIDRAGNIHARVGKVSMAADAIRENVLEVMKRLFMAKPAGVKRYLLSASLSSTMGRSVALDLDSLSRETRAYQTDHDTL